MTPIFVDVVPILTPVLLAVAIFLMSSFGVFARLAWKDAREEARARRLRLARRRVQPLRQRGLAH